MTELQTVIETAFENRASIAPGNAEPHVREAVAEVLTQLDAGKLRVAEKIGADWVTHQWIKKAVLLSFRLEDNGVVPHAIFALRPMPSNRSSMRSRQGWIGSSASRSVRGVTTRAHRKAPASA